LFWLFFNVQLSLTLQHLLCCEPYPYHAVKTREKSFDFFVEAAGAGALIEKLLFQFLQQHKLLCFNRDSQQSFVENCNAASKLCSLWSWPGKRSALSTCSYKFYYPNET
jgi:hypothetical protein